jgi:hypothetical protein
LLSLVTAPGTIFVSQGASLMQAFLSEQTGKNIQAEEKTRVQASTCIVFMQFHKA